MSREVVSARDAQGDDRVQATAPGTVQDELRKIAVERSKATGLEEKAAVGGSVGYGKGRGVSSPNPGRQSATAPSKPQVAERAPDTYASRLLKYVPAEVVALFLTLDALIRSSTQVPLLVYWAVFLFCVAATYGISGRSGRCTSNRNC